MRSVQKAIIPKAPKDSLMKLKFTSLLLSLLATAITTAQFSSDLYIIKRDGKEGFVNNDLKVVIDPIYESIGGFQEKFFGDYAIVRLDNLYGVINLDGDFVLKPVYKELSYASTPGVFQFREGETYGLIDFDGNVLLKPLFNYNIEFVNNGKNLIVSKEGQFGILNRKGKIKTPFIYDFIGGDFDTEIFPFRKGEKSGFLDKKGKVVIPATFDIAEVFKDNYAVVVSNKKYGIINLKGDYVIDPIYDHISTQARFPMIPHPRNDKTRYYLKKSGKYGLLDENLKTIVPFIYDEIGSFNENFAFVKKDGKYGYINIEGELVIPMEYEDADIFSEGLAAVVKNGKWGYINRKNEVVIDFKLTGYAEPFFDDLAVYRKRNFKSSKANYTVDRCGYINKTGDIVMEPIYKGAFKFINGVARVQDNQYEYLINKQKDKIILKSIEDEIMVEEIEVD